MLREKVSWAQLLMIQLPRTQPRALHAGGEAYVAEAVLRLVRELDIQIMDDGVQWEQSPMYHNEVLRCLLEVLRVAGQQGISLPRSLPEKARAMALADLAWMKPDRTQPLNGDSDRTDLRDVFTPAAWILRITGSGMPDMTAWILRASGILGQMLPWNTRA